MASRTPIYTFQLAGHEAILSQMKKNIGCFMRATHADQEGVKQWGAHFD